MKPLHRICIVLVEPVEANSTEARSTPLAARLKQRCPNPPNSNLLQSVKVSSHQIVFHPLLGYSHAIVALSRALAANGKHGDCGAGRDKRSILPWEADRQCGREISERYRGQRRASIATDWSESYAIAYCRMLWRLLYERLFMTEATSLCAVWRKDSDDWTTKHALALLRV